MKAQLKKLTVWLIVLAMATACMGVLAMAEGVIAPLGESGVKVDENEITSLGGQDPVDPPADPAGPVEQPAENGGSEPERKDPIEQPTAKPAEEPTVTPKPPVEYTITFVWFNGERDKALVKPVLDIAVIKEPSFTPKAEGFTFSFWYDDDLVNSRGEKIIVPFVFGGAPVRNMRLVAFFIEDEAGDVGIEALGGGEPEGPAAVEPDEDAIKVLEGDGQGEGDGETFYVDPDEELGPEEEGEKGGEETIEDEIVPLAGPELSVTITSSAGEYAEIGETVTLTAHLSGFDGLMYVISWYYFDGSDWLTAPGGSGLTYQYTVTEDTPNMLWQVKIVVIDQEIALTQVSESV